MKGIEDKIADRLRDMRGGDSQDKEALWAAIEGDMGASTSGGGSIAWKGAAVIGMLFLGAGLTWWGLNESIQEEDTGRYTPRQEIEIGTHMEQNEVLAEEVSDPSGRIEELDSTTGQETERFSGGDEVDLSREEYVASNNEVRNAYPAIDKNNQRKEEYSESDAQTASSNGVNTTETDHVLVEIDAEKTVRTSDLQVPSGSSETGQESISASDVATTSGESGETYSSSSSDSSIGEQGDFSSSFSGASHVLEMPSLGLMDMENPLEKDIYQSARELPEAEYLSDEKSLWPHYLSVYSGVNQAILTMSYDADPEGNTSDAALSDLIGHSSSLTAQWHVGDKLFVRTGIGYHQLRQCFELYREQAGFVTLSDHLIGFEQDTSGMALPVYGEHEQAAVFSRSVQHYNLYKVIAVPVRLGYEHHFSAYVIQASAGIDLQWLSSQQGKLLDIADEVQLFDTNNGPLPSFSMAYAMDMDVSRKLDQRWSIGLRPGLSFAPEKSGQQEGLSTKTFRWQAMLGLNYRIR